MKYKNPGPNIIKNRLGTMRIRLYCGFAFFLLIFLLTISHSYASIFNYSSTTINGSANTTDNGRSIVINPANGDVCVTGYVTEASQNIYLARYNSNLLLQSSTTITSAGEFPDSGNGIAVSGNGDIYLTGYTRESNQDMWVARYSSSCNLISSVTFNGSNNGIDEGKGIAIDSTGKVYVIGYVNETNSGNDIRIVKFDSSLVFQSSITINGPDNSTDEGYGIAVDSINNIYVTGKVSQNTNSDIWIAKYNSSLVLQSSTTLTSPDMNEDSGHSITIYDSNVYVTGILYESTNDDIWIAKFDSSLICLSSSTFGEIAFMDQGMGIVIDSNENLYITGLVNDTNQDIWIAKYNSSLILQSSITINGSSDNTDAGYAIAIDTNTNSIYVTGSIMETSGASNIWLSKHSIETGIFVGNFSQGVGATYDGSDFDSANGVAVDTFTAGCPYIYVVGASSNGSTASDFYVIKYDSNGGKLKTATYNSPANSDDTATDVVVDHAGNVIVTGYTYNSNNYDYFTIKYDSNLNVISSVTYNNEYAEVAYAVAVDGSNNIIITGYVSDGNSNYFTIKYSPNLAVISSATFNNGFADVANAVAVDDDNNIFITGYSNNSSGYSDAVTIKYDTDLNVISSVTYTGTGMLDRSDLANSIDTDESNNVIIAGYTHNGANYDYFTVKYNNDLTIISSATFNGPANSDDICYDVDVDLNNNIYITGESKNSSFNYDFVTIKYNSYMVFQSSIGYDNGNMNERAYAVAVGSDTSIYVTGRSNNGSNDDFRTIKYTLYSDDVLPAGISDLTALTGDNQGEIVLKWTAPGDDGDSGTINGQYEIKFTSISQITNANYGSPPNPTYTINISTYYSQPLLEHTTTLYNLQSETIYWFAIKVRDETYNWSVWNSSNEASVNLSASTTTLNPDTTLPTSGITCPDTPFVKSLLTISGTANDNTGLENVSIRISSYTSGDWITQQNWTIVQDSATWQYMYSNWQNGVKYKIEVKAKDTSMNEQNPLTSHEFTYDISMPTVTITSPDTGFVNSDNLTSISGTALDYPTGPSPDFASPGGILKVQIRIKSQYGNSYWDGSSNNYAIDSSNSEMAWYDAIAVNSDWTVWKSTKPMLYNTSSYVLEAKAIDKADNSTTYISTRSFIVDNVKPQSSVESPANFSTRCNFSTFDTISGTSSDDESSVANVKVYIRKNSAPYKWYLKDGEPGFSEDVETPNNATNVASWTFELLENKLTSGVSYYIYSSAQDSANNSEDLPGSGPSTFLWDVTEPTSVVKNANVLTGYVNDLLTISGTAEDVLPNNPAGAQNSGGVNKVQIQISSHTGSEWSILTNWSDTGIAVISGTQISSYTYITDSQHRISGKKYLIKTRAFDNALSDANIEVGDIKTGYEIIYDTNPPVSNITKPNSSELSFNTNLPLTTITLSANEFPTVGTGIYNSGINKVYLRISSGPVASAQYWHKSNYTWTGTSNDWLETTLVGGNYELSGSSVPTWENNVQYRLESRSLDMAGNYEIDYTTRTFTYDGIPPAGISNLTALIGWAEGQIILRWTAPRLVRNYFSRWKL